MIRTKQSMYISTYTPYILQRARTHTHTHTIYFTESHIFYRRGDNAQNIPRRTCTPQSSTANTACKVRASPSSITAAFPLSNADGENSSRRPRQTNVPPCNCRLHACERSCLRSAAVFGLSNARVFAGAPLSVPARPCICFFLFLKAAKSILAGSSEAFF